MSLLPTAQLGGSSGATMLLGVLGSLGSHRFHPQGCWNDGAEGGPGEGAQQVPAVGRVLHRG